MKNLIYLVKILEVISKPHDLRDNKIWGDRKDFFIISSSLALSS